MAVRTLASGLPMEDRAARDAERSRVWRKLVRNPAAIAGVLVLAAVVAFGRQPARTRGVAGRVPSLQPAS